MGRFGVGSAIAVMLVLMIFGVSFGWINVHPTEVAVVVEKMAHKVDPMPRGIGYHVFNRWATDMVVYTVSARPFPKNVEKSEKSDEYTMVLKTNDGQKIDIDMTIIYSLRANEVPLLHQQVGPNYESQIILPQLNSEARLTIGEFSAEQIYQGLVRDAIQEKVKEKLIKSLSTYPAIQIQNALLRHFKFSPEFEKAIEEKKLASQRIEINKNLALAAEENAKKMEADARGEKLKIIQGAQGDAEAKHINADAEKYRLEAIAAGNLANFKAEAEGKRLLTEAMGGGQNVVALAFAERIPDKLQIYAYPVGEHSTSIMDVSGLFKNMLTKRE